MVFVVGKKKYELVEKINNFHKIFIPTNTCTHVYISLLYSLTYMNYCECVWVFMCQTVIAK